jgi:hypothetical protein
MHENRSRERQLFVIRMRWISTFAFVLVLALGGCVAPVAPTISGDGDYQGSATRFQVLRRTCPRPGLFRLSVRGGVTWYRWENEYIQVSVLNNGTLSGALPGVQLTGTHDGTIMQGNVTDGQCGLHFTLKRIAS